MKRCVRCQCNRLRSEFSWKSKGRGRLASYCKACMREYSKQHYYLNGRNHNKRRYRNTLEYKRRNRAFIVDYLRRHPCVDCGEANPIVLEFDHVRGEKRGNISEIVSAGWSLAYIAEEIAKCDVRCANCHRIRTVAQFAWFKSNEAPNSEMRPLGT